MAGLTLKNINKKFKNADKATVKDINLQIDEDDFLVLLGPSGCGKTTLLRMISGLLEVTEGQIFIGDEDVTELEPQERGIGMVFQNYALYPHMNVRKNLSFALETAHMKRSERNEVIDKVGEMLDIKRHFRKKPHMLSGGERQRVAMGRAMVKECKIYLMDEPLSNLDEALRARLRPEILKQFHELQVPFVYVTHDQVDAMTMGTKVAVMKEGEIQQFGTPKEIYDYPANVFVAGFVGTPKMNFIEVHVENVDGKLQLTGENLSLYLPKVQEKLESYVGKSVIVGIRPEDLLVTKNSEYQEPLCCILEKYEHWGNRIQLFAHWGESTICITAPLTVRAKVGEKLTIYMDKEKLHLFDAETGMRL
jgi:multiple sugar transport system ATP-binding protein